MRTSADIRRWILEGLRAGDQSRNEARRNSSGLPLPLGGYGLQLVPVVPGHPALRIVRRLVGISLQLGEVIERIRVG